MVGRLTGEEGCTVPVLRLYKGVGRVGAGTTVVAVGAGGGRGG